MIGEVPGVIIALVIGVVIAALAVGIAKQTKNTGTAVLGDLENAAEEALN